MNKINVNNNINEKIEAIVLILCFLFTWTFLHLLGVILNNDFLKLLIIWRRGSSLNILLIPVILVATVISYKLFSKTNLYTTTIETIEKFILFIKKYPILYKLIKFIYRHPIISGLAAGFIFVFIEVYVLNIK